MALTTNLVAYYKLDESSGNASDSSGNGYTLTNNNSISYATGKINNGADLGASNSSKYFSHASLHGFTSPTNAQSLSCWVKVSTSPTSGETQFFVSQFIGETTGGDWKISHTNEAGTLKIRFTNDGGGSIGYNTTLTTGTWYHIVGTFSGSNVAGSTKLYLNGSEVASGNLYGTVDYSPYADSFTIGANRNGSSVFMKGVIDEVGQWSRELSSSEVSELYNSGSGNQYPFATNVTVTPSVNTATFSIPSYTVSAERYVTVTPTVQTATFSIPSSTIVISVTTAPSTQTATFTIPAYTIIADGNVSYTPSVQTCTFSIPSYTPDVTANPTITPSVQVCTFTIPSYTVSVTANITIAPTVFTATFSILTYTALGDYWEEKFAQPATSWSDKIAQPNTSWSNKF